MGFVSGIVVGILCGIALVYGWSLMMELRSRKRVNKAADIKVLGSLSRDDMKKLCGDNFSEWISFPEFESVKWLNKLLTKLWPFVAEAARQQQWLIRGSVEHLLDDYKPPCIASLKFSKLSLGHVSPKIEGMFGSHALYFPSRSIWIALIIL